MGCGSGSAKLTRDHDPVGLNVSDCILKAQELEEGIWVVTQDLEDELEIAAELAKRGPKTPSPVDLKYSSRSPLTHLE